MKKKTFEEENKLLKEFVQARDKYKERKSKINLSKFEKLRNLCCEKFDYIAERRTYKYKNFDNYEDLKQEARLALISALKTYKPEKGPFPYWAVRYVKTKVSRMANCHSTIKIPLKKAREIKPFKVSKMPEGSYTPDLGEDMDNEYWKQQIANVLSNLPREQKKVVEILFYNENSVKNSRLLICKELGIDEEECITLINDTKEILKSKFEKVA